MVLRDTQGYSDMGKNGKLAELLGELVSEEHVHNSRISNLMEEQEKESK